MPVRHSHARLTARRALLLALAVAALLALVPAWRPAAAGAAAEPTLALDPASGPCGTRPLARGAGFPAGLPVMVQRGNDNGPILGRATTAADGAFEVVLGPLCDDAAPRPAGSQVQVVASPDASRGAAPGNPPLRVSATFTVTAGGPRRERCFPETGFCVGGRFLEYWEATGGLSRHGYPLSKEFQQRLEDGQLYTVQYFERVRLEWHPQNPPPYDVLLGQFGRRILATVPDAPTAPVPADPANQYGRYFPETGHNVRGSFAGYWEAFGGLAQFGYPLSEEFEERLEDGNVYTVQYFERARLERHPEVQAQWNILLGQFGRRILAETTGGPNLP